MSPTQITFTPQIIMDYSDPVTVTISNIGDSTMQIVSSILSGSAPGGFIVNDTNRYPVILVTGSSMFFTITFHPVAAMQYNAQLIITDNLGLTQHLLPLAGLGSTEFINEFPYSEGFEHTYFPPSDWAVVNSANPSGGWRRSIYGNQHSGSTYSVAGLQPGDHWLITPPFIVTQQSNTVHFWLKNGNESSDSTTASLGEYLDIKLSTTVADTASFLTVLEHYTNASIPETYMEVVLDLSVYSGSIVRIAFLRHSANGKYVYLDDFLITEPPAGAYNPPTDLYAEVDGNTVTLSWEIPEHQTNEPLSGYKIYRNNILLHTSHNQLSPLYIDLNVPYGYYSYEVSALYGNIESDFSNPFNVDATFGYPNLIFTDSFDAYPDFSTSFGLWANLDMDLSSTFNFDEIAYPNMTIPKSWMVFNPIATNPPMTYLSARSSYKMLACFDSANPPNNDWLITPHIQLGTNSSINFWAKSYTAYYGLEKFNFLVSTTDLNPGSFISITGEDTVHVPAVQWTSFNYDLSAYDNHSVYVAMQCVSDFAVALLLDDFKIISAGGNVGVDEPVAIERHSMLLGNYPNPFNPETMIRYQLKEKGKVLIEIYNIRGQKIRTLSNEEKNQGTQSVLWNGKDNEGNAVASGVYFYQMKTGNYTQTKKMILIK